MLYHHEDLNLTARKTINGYCFVTIVIVPVADEEQVAIVIVIYPAYHC